MVLSLSQLRYTHHPLIQKLRIIKRRIFKVDDKHFSSYRQTRNRLKLHIGASNHCLDGWFNTDLNPSEGVGYLDATKTFPYPDKCFDFVYAEHMIEHIPYEDATRMIKECLRVLKPGGVLRVVTPDLDSILSTTHTPLDPIASVYLQWMTKTFLTHVPECSPTYVINAMFRMWGHQFIYDLDSLSSLLSAAGFINITQCSIDESSHSDLKNLSNADRYPPGLLDFESLCLEASHP